jgi:membrane protein YqaA with SNARE-associated domain
MQADVPLLLLAAVAIVAGGGGLLPFAPVEPLLIAIAATSSVDVAATAVLVATVSHAAAKALLFVGSRGAERYLSPRARAVIDRLRGRLHGKRGAQRLTVFVSSSLGLPPLYLVTIACGALGLPLRDYMIASLLGRGLRFAALALLPILFTGSYQAIP